MNVFVAEFIGTAILILLGNGVVANVVLKKSKGHSSGWIVITTAWGLAVMTGAYCIGWISGAHLNPALTIGFAVVGFFPAELVFGYVTAQLLGAIEPAIRDLKWNFVTETIGTFMLVFGLLAIGHVNNQAFSATLPNGDVVKGFTGILGPLLAGFYVWSIGLSLGGPTGYAINPARDLGPRIMHAILPIANKKNSDWSYAWVPIAGPIIGGIIGAITFATIFN